MAFGISESISWVPGACQTHCGKQSKKMSGRRFPLLGFREVARTIVEVPNLATFASRKPLFIPGWPTTSGCRFFPNGFPSCCLTDTVLFNFLLLCLTSCAAQVVSLRIRINQKRCTQSCTMSGFAVSLLLRNSAWQIASFV